MGFRIGVKVNDTSAGVCAGVANPCRNDVNPLIRPKSRTRERRNGMSKGKQTEAQIIAALKHMAAGEPPKMWRGTWDCPSIQSTPWRSKYGGMDVSEAQEVKQLRNENARLKKLVADLNLDKNNAAIGDSKKALGS